MNHRKAIAWSCAGSAVVAAGLAFAAPVAEGGRKFVTALTGQAELDGGALTADMDGTGTAQVFVNHGQRRVCWNLTNLSNLDTLVAAHIHQAPSNATGGSGSASSTSANRLTSRAARKAPHCIRSTAPG